jgi:hypothetical protein
MATGNQRRISITPLSHYPTLKHRTTSFLLHLMTELPNDTLHFFFPDLHPDAHCTVSFQRTLRIPDNDETWPLPPGLDRFPIVHADDFAATLPPKWKEHGGVAFPMYQSEAMWIAFSRDDYPLAIKIAAGRIDAVTGKPWSVDLVEQPQNYVVIPTQPWLDGFCVTGRCYQAVSRYAARCRLHRGRTNHGSGRIRRAPDPGLPDATGNLRAGDQIQTATGP